jgi:hypothetical protein
MLTKFNLQSWDIVVVVVANIINILLSIIFVVRAQAGTRATQTEHILGLIIVGMIAPLALTIAVNVLSKRGIWYWILPAITILYLILEFALDYLQKGDFRSTSLLVPYLILFYLSQFAMVGYSFITGKTYGFITLLTYFINLAATFFSYARIRHG